MNNIVSFQNKGFLDLRRITTFGISAKVNKSPIGYFGTGLKYAIAIILREGGKLTLRNGTDYFEFYKKKESVRSKEFEFILMKEFGQDKETQLPFTTELGKNWKLWQAYRELYCNTLDENGIISEGELLHNSEQVTWYVDSEEFYETHQKKEEFILDSCVKPIYQSAEADVYLGDSGNIFYKGIKVGEIEDSAIFFNMRNGLELTEDRTIKNMHPVDKFYKKYICEISTDEALIMQCLVSDYFSVLYFDRNLVTPSECFLGCLQKARKLGIRINEGLARLENVNFLDEIVPIVGNKRYLSLVEKAIDFLKKAELIRKDSFYETVIIEKFMNFNNVARAYKGKIYLSKRLMDSGLKQITTAYLEEYYHLEFNLVDKTYEFQNFLFDKLITQAEITIGEVI